MYNFVKLSLYIS